MNTHPHPQNVSGGTQSLKYHSAYYGIVTDRHGKFTNFVRRPDDSHLRNGYWRFNSLQDEHLAYFRGLRTPEDLLRAVDRGDGTHEDISLRWIPGQIDTVLKRSIAGFAGQHLREIYDMRRFLGKPLSFRNQVPLYPVHPRMREYWDTRRLPETPGTQNAADTMHDGPSSSHVHSAKGTSPAVEAAATKQLSSKHHPLQTTKSFSNGQIATNNAASTVAAAQTPITPTTLRPPPTVSENPSSQQSSLLPRHQPQSHQDQNEQCSQRSVPTPFSPFVAQARSSTKTLVGQPHGTPFEANRPSNDCGSRVEVVESGGKARPVAMGESPPAQNSQNYRLDPAFPQPTQQAPQSWRIQSGGSPGKFEQVKVPISQQLHNSASFVTPARARTKHGVNSANVSPASSGNIEGMQSPSPSPGSFHTVMEMDTDEMDTATTTPVSGLNVPGAIMRESSTHTMVANDLRTMDNVPNNAFQRSAVAQNGHRNISSPKRRLEFTAQELRKDKRQKGDHVLDKIQRPCQDQPVLLPKTDDMFPGLACMDCGEETGHKLNCFVGNSKPLEKLTILDYRNLTESVQRFDPGPWTTHQGLAPEPEPEDTSDQLQGMADFIRNEDDYKSDTNLHHLPDCFMIVAWAMKSSPGFVLTHDFADDSGIGESDPE
ncbi:hypothetical protein BDU57DRAFT_273071 [Ampelomyces quisqualis]|uniref:Uncharacterized protein n=1 Tax=Ampelomyces quisqualis TaxID=50730 RepID=A0A6A5QIK3_AMPQU|nr:hypothetical protein BDU57DRAFT_273071 [Ampelomyces quisqualis]